MLNIILTIDYEVFGDGSGEVLKHIVEPTDRIVKICDQFSVPITIMFEINEYNKFVEYDTVLVRDLGYSPSRMIYDQVRELYKNGHDVQLHIHPQWIDAQYNNGRWSMNNPNLSITAFSERKIIDIIKEGKETLESVFNDIDPEYSVKALRFTNLPWVEAPSVTHAAMKANSIKIHSLCASSSYRSLKGYWPLDKTGTIFEIPIYSLHRRGYEKLSWHRIKTALYRRLYTKDAIGYNNDASMNKDNKSSFIDKALSIILGYDAIKWDFCKQPCNEMIRFLEEGMELYDYTKNEIPLVMISHSKDFFNDKHLVNFLSVVTNDYSKYIRFSTFNEFVSSNLI